MSYDFLTTTHGKWILAGEHAVTRGQSAIVFPVNEKKLQLSYHPSGSELSATYQGDAGADTHLLFWSVLEQGMQLLGRSLNSLSGHFDLCSNIPVGVGMGASAALCVAMARWFVAFDMLPNKDIHAFATDLEHLFHGKSSGLDIIGVAASSGMYFKQGTYTPLTQAWQPHWFLSSCGQIGITSHCINQVQSLWSKDPILGEKLDKKMADSVEQARLALAHDTPKSRLMLAEAIHSASACFQQWGLVSERLEHHMKMLLDAGAVAVKPTGSGEGGYVVSLWDSAPKEKVMELIAV